ncbi:MAG: hypothetical protein EOM05_03550 [Clostridia bacterium]|nr:hypothetical protein [Clostridia bacterium]
MIGVGKWQFSVNTIFFKGNAVLEIIDKNGKYGFNVEIPGVNKIPSYFISHIAEKGNTLTVKGGSDMLPGKEVEVVASFDGDTCNGHINAPFFGKIMIKNGRKIG